MFPLVGVVFSALLSGCTTTRENVEKYQLKEVDERSVAYVQPTSCAYQEFKFDEDVKGLVAGAPILAVAIPVIANAAYDGAVNFVKELNEKSSADYIATGLAELDKDKCISIVRGVIVNSPEKSNIEEGDDNVAQWLNRGVLRDDLSLKDVPPFLLEVRVTGTSDGMVEIQPHYILFQESASKYFKMAKKNIGVVLVLREQVVEADDADSVKKGAEYVFAMNFGEVMPGTYLRGRASFPDMQAALQVEKGKVFNAYAIVVEADEPSPIVELVATVAEKGKDNLLSKLPDGS
ncbi:hypothetical protein [Thalassospira povalilytica]|uniref:hypothetical protein n=1 Tax=Thalassospira povalilytica TaxID=732237 RepID=UPI003AA813B6